MLWDCFGFSGCLVTLTPIEGMMNSAYYSKLIRRTVSCDMQRAFPEGEGVFQQDLAPCHTSKQVKKVFKAAISILNCQETRSISTQYKTFGEF